MNIEYFGAMDVHTLNSALEKYMYNDMLMIYFTNKLTSREQADTHSN